jgi:hypothetical protein
MKLPPKVHQNNASSLPQNLLPAHPLAHRFFHYFNHTWDFILKPSDGEWKTYTEFPLKPRTLWRFYTGERVIVGLRFDEQTNYGLLDLDAGSLYHPSNDPVTFRKLIKTLRKLGIYRIKVISSSDSGGLHVYFFLPDFVRTIELAAGLKQKLTKAGFEISPGKLEIFPNTKRYSDRQITLYNGHRLPLQEGSYLLDENFQPVSNNLEDFLDAADWCAAGQDFPKLKRTIKRAYQWHKDTPKTWEYRAEGGGGWRGDLEERIEEGWTGSGQTNELLKDIANYGVVFQGSRTVPELAEYIHRRAIALPGYQQWCDHHHNIQQRCTDWAKSAVQYWSSYPSKPQRTISYDQLYDHITPENDEQPPSKEKPTAKSQRTPDRSRPRTRRQINQERREDSINRLKQAIAHLEKRCLLPKKIGDLIEAICRASKELFSRGFSRKTLLKALYLPLWHPKHRSTESMPSEAAAKRDLSQKIPPPPVTNRQQPEVPEDKDSKKRSHFPDVVPPTEPKNESLEVSPSKGFRKKDPTIMKCFEQPSADSVKSEIKVALNNQNFVQISEYRTSEEKLKQNELMIGKIYQFVFNSVSGLVESSDAPQPKLHSISKNILVKVLDSYHGSSLSDDRRPLIVYVKPATGAENWQSGIAVSEFHLKPIDFPPLDKGDLSLKIRSEPPLIDKQNLSKSSSDPPNSEFGNQSF